MSNQIQIRSEITNKIVDAIKAGGLPPWRPTWNADANCGLATNIASRRQYTGINPLILQATPWRSKWWGTVKQWNELGGSIMRRPEDVMPGEWGTRICYWSKITKQRIDADGKEKEESFFFLKTYHVFNVEQVEGDHLDHLRAGNAPLSDQQIEERYETAERAIEAIPAMIRHGGDRAFYSTANDSIQVPHRHQFESSGAYYETVFHELGHWSESRTGWDRNQNSYAAGELRAELAACFMLQSLGIEGGGFDLSCSYLKHWVEQMENDPSFIFMMSASASKAVDYLLGFSQEAETVAAELVA